MSKVIDVSKLPTAAKNLVNVLNLQSYEAVTSGNWRKVDLEFTQDSNSNTFSVIVPSSEIGFVFDGEQFQGIYNYKQ